MPSNNSKPGSPARAGVIGLGVMGRNHARIFSQLDSVELAAVSDPLDDVLQNVAKRMNARPYADYREMLDSEDLDLVTVAVPTHLHRRVAEDVIERGIHLLVEKPLALTIADAEKIIELARSKGVRLGVGHVERFNPVITALKKHLDEGELGRVFQITIRRIGPFPSRIKDVGVFLDIATHDIDVMYYLTGAEVLRISAESAQWLHDNYEDLAVGLLRFSNGVIGVLIENWLSPTKVREVTVNGERGMLVADFITQDLYFYENTFTSSGWETLRVLRGVGEGKMIRYPMAREEPLRVELEAFARSVVEEEPFLVSGEDGLRAVRLAQQLAERAIQNRHEYEFSVEDELQPDISG